MTSAKDIMKMMADNEVKFVDLRFTDTRGKEQHVSVPTKAFVEDKFTDGHAFDGGSHDDSREARLRLPDRHRVAGLARSAGERETAPVIGPLSEVADANATLVGSGRRPGSGQIAPGVRRRRAVSVNARNRPPHRKLFNPPTD